MFAALKLLAQRDRAADQKAEWRLLLKAVHAKASLDENVTAQQRDDLHELFADDLYDAEDENGLKEDDVNFDFGDNAKFAIAARMAAKLVGWRLVMPSLRDRIRIIGGRR